MRAEISRTRWKSEPVLTQAEPTISKSPSIPNAVSALRSSGVGMLSSAAGEASGRSQANRGRVTAAALHQAYMTMGFQRGGGAVKEQFRPETTPVAPPSVKSRRNSGPRRATSPDSGVGSRRAAAPAAAAAALVCVCVFIHSLFVLVRWVIRSLSFLCQPNVDIAPSTGTWRRDGVSFFLFIKKRTREALHSVFVLVYRGFLPRSATRFRFLYDTM